MTKTMTLVTGLLAAIACTLMACGSADGPSESDPTSAETSGSTEKADSIWYECNGSHKPCSPSELDAIMSSPSYNKKTGHFTATDGAECQVCGANLPSLCAPN